VHYRLDDWGSIIGRGKGLFLYPLCPDQLNTPIPASCPMGTGRVVRTSLIRMKEVNIMKNITYFHY
jgi:hypothetical protein